MKGKDFVKASDVAEAIDLKSSRTRDYLGELVKEGLIITEGSNRNRIYKLKKKPLFPGGYFWIQHYKTKNSEMGKLIRNQEKYSHFGIFVEHSIILHMKRRR